MIAGQGADDRLRRDGHIHHYIEVLGDVLGSHLVLGDALVHGVIPGIALAVMFDFNLLLGALGAALVMVFGINFVHRQTEFSEDTGIGLLFAGMLALGVILISTTEGANQTLTAILFGNALGVTRTDIVVLVVVVLAINVISAIVPGMDGALASLPIVVLLLVTVLIILGSSSAAPFIYTLF